MSIAILLTLQIKFEFYFDWLQEAEIIVMILSVGAKYIFMAEFLRTLLGNHDHVSSIGPSTDLNQLHTYSPPIKNTNGVYFLFFIIYTHKTSLKKEINGFAVSSVMFVVLGEQKSFFCLFFFLIRV